MAETSVQARVFRLPASAYLAVLFLVFCAVPLSFGSGSNGSPVYGPRALIMLIPVVAIVFIARTATFVDAAGIRIRAAFGTRRLAWSDVRGLSVQERSVFAVIADGAVRLPCVRIADLASVSRASGGRLPELVEATPKYAPQRRRRR